MAGENRDVRDHGPGLPVITINLYRTYHLKKVVKRGNLQMVQFFAPIAMGL